MSIRLFNHAPRAYLFTRPLALRSFSVSLPPREKEPHGGSFASPSPFRLPKEEQEIFESLQRESTGAFSTPRSPPNINQSPDASPIEAAEAREEIARRTDKIAESSTPSFTDEFKKVIEARGDGEELHPNVRRGAQPEFEGDKNPKTGEVGGPKNEPLRWGPGGEWSYNGRTTDF